MQKRMACVLFCALVFLGVYAQAQMPTPSAEHQKLGFWIGTWEIEGRTVETPFWTPGEFHATMNAEWFEGKFHVICRYKWGGAWGDYSELNILGFDAAVGEYYRYAIDGYGTGNHFKGTMKENVWTYLADTNIEGKAVKYRWTVVDESPGLIMWKSEMSIDGGPWILAGDAKAVRE